LSRAKYPSANASATITSRSSRLPIAWIVGEDRSTSLSRINPWGVSSKAQAEITAGKKPIARKMTTPRIAASPNPKAGKMVSTTWMTSHATAT
jgi:hypothetical protein